MSGISQPCDHPLSARGKSGPHPDQEYCAKCDTLLRLGPWGAAVNFPEPPAPPPVSVRLKSVYEIERDVMRQYLKHKLELDDWHGVSDAANDLRVLEAAHGRGVDSGGRARPGC